MGIIVTLVVLMFVWEKLPAFIATGHCRCHLNVMDAWACRQPETEAVSGLTCCVCFNSEIHCCLFKWFAAVQIMERAHGSRLEPSIVLSCEKQLVLRKALEMLIPAGQSCAAVIHQPGVCCHHLWVPQMSVVQMLMESSLLEPSLRALTLVPDKSQHWLSGFFHLFSCFLYMLRP